MSDFKGTYGAYLRETDYNWIKDHIDMWNNEDTVLYIEITYTTPNYWSLGVIHKTGPDSYKASWSRNWSQSADPYGPQDYISGGFWSSYTGSSTTIKTNFTHESLPTNPILFCNNGYGYTTDAYDTLGISTGGGIEDSETYNYEYDENALITLRSLKFNIFEKLADYEDFFTNPNALNSVYIGERSGNKYASEIVLANLNSSGQLEDTAVDNLARIVLGKFSTNWEKLFNTLTLEYDPLENYNRTEILSNSDSDVQTPTNWKTTDTSLLADNSEKTSNSVYGFNSSNPVPESESEKTSAHKNTSEQSGTFTVTHNYGRKSETFGNIGVTTSQQMLQSERDVAEWNFWEKVFNDLDTLLTKNYIGGLN